VVLIVLVVSVVAMNGMGLIVLAMLTVRCDRSAFVVLHALGAAVSKAIDIGRFLVEESAGELAMSITTSTEALLDDYVLRPASPLPPHHAEEEEEEEKEEEEKEEELQQVTQMRLVSAVHVKVFQAEVIKTKAKSKTTTLPSATTTLSTRGRKKK